MASAHTSLTSARCHHQLQPPAGPGGGSVYDAVCKRWPTFTPSNLHTQANTRWTGIPEMTQEHFLVVGFYWPRRGRLTTLLWNWDPLIAFVIAAGMYGMGTHLKRQACPCDVQTSLVKAASLGSLLLLHIGMFFFPSSRFTMENLYSHPVVYNEML